MKIQRSRVGMIFVVWAVVVVAAGWGWWWFLAPRGFDGGVWKDRPGERSRMVDDLLRGERLKGKTREEVVELLGGDAEARGASLVYRVGSDGVIDDVWLDVVFEGGRCRGGRVYSD